MVRNSDKDSNRPDRGAILAAALDYAQRGWLVAPLYGLTPSLSCTCKEGPNCKRAGKHPRIKGWQDGLDPDHASAASRNAHTIQGWWECWPASGVCIVTGPASGLFVLDSDGSEADELLLDLVHTYGLLPPAPKVRTGSGGYHLYYRWPKDCTLTTAAKIGGLPLDYRGAGGQVVAPPTLHSSGNVYRWEVSPDQVELHEPPDWLLDWFETHRGKVVQPTRAKPGKQKATPPSSEVEHRAMKYLAKCPPAISGQGGHDQMYAVARALVWGFDLGEEQAFRILAEHYNPRCQPPWSDVELQHKTHDAATKEHNKPRGYLLAEPRRSDSKPAQVVQYTRPAVALPPGQQPVPIMLHAVEWEVVHQACVALGNDPTVYQRAQQLVRIVQPTPREDNLSEWQPGPRIEEIPPPSLRERLTVVCRFMKRVVEKKEKVVRAAHPPDWLAGAVASRAVWPEVRPIDGVVTYPVLRADGSVLEKPGYDPASRLYLQLECPWKPLPAHLTIVEAQRAAAELLDVVCDVPFEADHHRSAWLAALLTLPARYAFAGPCPFFMVDANLPAAGKGLVVDCISNIVLGQRLGAATYTNDEAELRKLITSFACSGARQVLFDNITGRFGNAVTDKLLTTTVWTDRVLGSSRDLEIEFRCVWFGTANNVTVGADTVRRICPIRILCPHEKPEERTGYKRPDLRAWCLENRERLLRAALIILRAFVLAGSPQPDVKGWGSFEGWSAMVRAAVMWCGLPDPAQGRVELQATSDTNTINLAALLKCWERHAGLKKGKTSSEVIAWLVRAPEAGEDAELHAEMKAVVEDWCGKLDTRALGNRIKAVRQRVLNGKFFDLERQSHRAACWAVYPESDFLQRLKTDSPDSTDSLSEGESDESGESNSGRTGKNLFPEIPPETSHYDARY